MLTDHLAELIEQMLEAGHGSLELRRNEFAQRNGVVPSQVTYVISSRFTPRRGYIVESKRGGGGCVKIRKIQLEGDNCLTRLFASIGEKLDIVSCEEIIAELCSAGIINSRETCLLSRLLSEGALSAVPREYRDSLRGSLMRQAILALAQA